MKKSDRVQSFVARLGTSPDPSWHPCYAGYFTCFNRGEYYEAHDVLEQLWLACTDSNAIYYQGLIQFAGAFVHLRHHHLHPTHRIHSRRLAPASRLFDLAARNLQPFAPHHLGLQLQSVLTLAENHAHAIRASDYTHNPWSPATFPTLTLQPK